MDRLIDLIVRTIVALAGYARIIPGISYQEFKQGEPLKILLVGYNGAKNTGSDVRVGAIAKQLTELFGNASIEISLMTLDKESTSCYFDPRVKQIEFPTLFFFDLFKACSQHHVAILCEGSTLKSKFANALTLYTCEAAGIMRAQGKPCLGLGSEVGEMDSYVKRAARDLCSDVHFAVRSKPSLEKLNELGIKGYVGTDTAWRFESARAHSEALDVLQQAGWDGKKPLLGIAPVNPFCWPVKASLAQFARTLRTHDRSLQFQSFYYFSSSPERTRKYNEYLEGVSSACLTFAKEHDCFPVVIGMEKLDADPATQVCVRMGMGGALVLSRDTNGFVITEILRSLSYLVTSRYHARVLAMAAAVPAVAISMDERLDNLSGEMGLNDYRLLHVDEADLGPRLLVSLDYLFENRETIQAQERLSYEGECAHMDEMIQWLKNELAPYISQ